MKQLCLSVSRVKSSACTFCAGLQDFEAALLHNAERQRRTREPVPQRSPHKIIWKQLGSCWPAGNFDLSCIDIQCLRFSSGNLGAHGLRDAGEKSEHICFAVEVSFVTRQILPEHILRRAAGLLELRCFTMPSADTEPAHRSRSVRLAKQYGQQLRFVLACRKFGLVLPRGSPTA